jgi:hypothetical protein
MASEVSPPVSPVSPLLGASRRPLSGVFWFLLIWLVAVFLGRGQVSTQVLEDNRQARMTRDDAAYEQAVNHLVGSDGTTQLTLAQLLELYSEMSQECVVLIPGIPMEKLIPARAPLLDRVGGLVRSRLKAVSLDEMINAQSATGTSGILGYDGFSILQQRWIDHELDVIAAEHRKPLQLKPSTGPLPASVAHQSPEVQKQWRYFHAVHEPWHRLLTNSSKLAPLGYAKNGALYQQVIEDFYQGKKHDTAVQLLRFYCDSSCGTGMWEVFDDRDRFVVMSLLRERRLAEAVGGAFQFLREKSPLDLTYSRTPWALRLLKLCGVDWQKASIGALASSDLTDGGDFSDGTFLLHHGGDASLKILVAKLGADMKSRPVYLEFPLPQLQMIALGIPPTSSLEAHAAWREGKISKATRVQALTVITDQLGRSSTPDELLPLLKSLDILQQPKSKSALRPLLKHPSSTVAEAAAVALRHLGEKVPPIKPNPPARFEVLVNGQPAVKTQVFWSLLHGSPQNAITDEDGIIETGRDPFLNNPEAGNTVKFQIRPVFDNVTRKPTPDGSWADVTMPVPKGFGQLIQVAFKAVSVPVEIGYPTGVRVKAGKELKLRLQHFPEHRSIFASDDEIFEYSLGNEKPRLPALMPGQWRLEIYFPQVGTWDSGIINMELGMKPIHAVLALGRDVIMRTNHEGYAVNQTFMATMTRNGKNFSRDHESFYSGIRYEDGFTRNSLPYGNYHLHLPSLAELLKAQPNLLDYYEGRFEHSFSGFDLDFEISESSPPIVTLPVYNFRYDEPAAVKRSVKSE